MLRTHQRFALALPLLLLAGAAGTAQEAGGPPLGRYQNEFEIHYLDVHAAESLAWEQCPEKANCAVRAETLVGGDAKSRGRLLVNADGPTQARIAQALAREDSAPQTQSFQVSFLAGTAKPDGPNPELPAGAQKALADLKSLFPFKGYRLLDTALLRTTQNASVRLAGPDGHAFEVSLRFRASGLGKERNLNVEGFRLTERFELVPAKLPRSAQELISTSFGLKVGETIVVGTSKVDGSDDALIVLLTALPAA